jgi:hypothetical protein
MESTTLAILLDEINIHKDLSNIETQYKVRSIDKAIRALRRASVFPWAIKKGSLRVFKGVKEYPTASDHDEMLYVDKPNIGQYADTARFHNTSLKDFFEDVQSSRNLMSEIWDGGTKYIGLNYKDLDLAEVQLDTAEDEDDYTVSGDATTAEEDSVVYKEGSGSIKVSITNSTNTATIKCLYDVAQNDSDYKEKYLFRWIYLDAVPTSIEMRLNTDDSNYLSASVTTQFSGQAFKADQWNLIAIDLNTAVATGTFTSTSIAGDTMVLTGAATGTYYVDSAYLRGWALFDYWYYSKYLVVATGSSSADQERFWRSNDYNELDSLIGDSEWVDVVLYEAMESLLAEVENVHLFSYIMRKKQEAWDDFYTKYPNMIPEIITTRYRFNNDPQNIYNI